MLGKLLQHKNIILASGSPRRQQFFKDLDVNFEIRLKEVEEIYPDRLQHKEITEFLSELKAKPFLKQLDNDDILVTSDTIVWHNNKALGKPKSESEAFEMIQSMSNQTHEVITSVCFTTQTSQKVISHVTKVTFKPLTKQEIDYYIKTYKPYDKAGAYGIQEWIGHIGISHIEGSYNNVVGLPIHMVYQELKQFI
ncbi:MAG: septum formation protein Maf [Flavobacteriaceae bacterium]|nr:septum formation protein Maf [Flavobacteriaceae bacterium]